VISASSARNNKIRIKLSQAQRTQGVYFNAAKRLVNLKSLFLCDLCELCEK
jgi:hypothetical protein